MEKFKKSIFTKIWGSILGISVFTGLSVLSFSLFQEIKGLERNFLLQDINLASIGAKAFEIGYINKTLPFQTLKKISERETVVFLWITNPEGKIYFSDQARFFGKKPNL